MSEQPQADRKDLKIQLLLNKNQTLENDNDNLRIELHLLTEAQQGLRQRIQELESEQTQAHNNESAEYVPDRDVSQD